MQSNKIKFGMTNIISGAVLTTDDPLTEQTVYNLANDYRAYEFENTNSFSGMIVNGVFGSDKTIDYFSLPSTTLGPESFVKLELFANTNADPDLLNMTLEPVFDVAVNDNEYGEDNENRRALTFWLSQSYTFKAFRLTVTASPSWSKPSITIRSLLLGESMTFNHNFSYSNNVSFLTPTDLIETTDGSLYIRRAQKKRKLFTFDLENLREVEAQKLALFERSLLSKSFVFSAFPSEDRTEQLFKDYTFMGRFDSEVNYLNVFEDIYSAVGISIQEI